MTTDLEKLTYISVDVETSDLRPDRGELLSIAAVAMNGYGHVVDDIYIRIQRSLPPHWYDESMVLSSTHRFWMDQDDYVKNEAYKDKTLERLDPRTAAHKFRNWVLDFGESWEDRIFVASPVSFDKMWALQLFMETNVEDPFHYRSLCLRSMAFGISVFDRGNVNFHDSDLRTHRPRYLHHPLSDAFAQLQDLADMLGYATVNEMDEPHYENAPTQAEDEIEEGLLALLEEDS